MAGLCKQPLEPYVQMLVDLYARAEGGFYSKLHPSDATFALEYKGFYAQSLAAIYDSMTEDKKEKVLRLSRHPAFLNEKLFRFIPDTDKIHLDMIPRVFKNWDIGKMKMSIGGPLKFLTMEYKHVDPIKLEGSKKQDPKKQKPTVGHKKGVQGHQATGIVDDDL